VAVIEVGPGTSFSPTGSDDQDIINAAIESADQGDTVQLASTTFHISAPINMKSGVTLNGNGIGATVIYCDDPSSNFEKQNIINCNGTSDIEISNFLIDGGWESLSKMHAASNKYRSYEKGVRLSGCSNAVIHDLKMQYSMGDFIYCSKKTSNVGVQSVLSYKAKTAYSGLSTINTRTNIWKNGLSAFRNSPVVGYGAGAFEYAYRKYFDGGSYTGVAHSLVIKTLVDLGLIGLLCLFFYLGGVLGRAKNSIQDPLGRFVAMSAAACFLFGLIDFSFDVASHVISFFVVSSFFFSRSLKGPESQTPSQSKYMHVVIFSVVLFLLIGNFLFNTKASLFSRSIENGDLMKENGFTLEALYSYRDANAIMPLSNEGYIKAITTLVQLYRAEKDDKARSLMMKELWEYGSALEKSSDKDSELSLTLGRAYVLKENHDKAHLYFDRALYYYPLSAYYIHEIASYYYSRGRLNDAQELIDVFRIYGDKYRSSNDPRGFMMYKIHDLEATIQHQKGSLTKAMEIAVNNYNDAKNGVFVITSVRAKEYVTREKLLAYLSERVRLFESEHHGVQK
jgi:tetratricopeptide (TPR) repeat protein